MRYFYVAIALSAFQAYTCDAAASATGSTVVCESCPTTTSTSQFVTRTSAPTTSCSAPALTVIPNAGASASTSGNSTMPPTATFTGAASKMVGSMGGAMAVALAAVYVL
ncbi:hypothetical protein VE02_01547 [Pseudogymnoascus sp. 03VT05]|nr:hypothetical protein VE02_01547 [Pseudogymnoascus sp. 03VT05]